MFKSRNFILFIFPTAGNSNALGWELVIHLDTSSTITDPVIFGVSDFFALASNVFPPAYMRIAASLMLGGTAFLNLRLSIFHEGSQVVHRTGSWEHVTTLSILVTYESTVSYHVGWTTLCRCVAQPTVALAFHVAFLRPSLWL